ncbi:MAG: hypothetical protein ACHQZS_06295 [Candidatus Binatales bacterium]
MSLRERVRQINSDTEETQRLNAHSLSDWLTDLKGLYGFVEKFIEKRLSEELRKGLVKVSRTPVQRYEESLGQYQTEELNFSLAGRVVVFSPVALRVIGSFGRVDVFLRGRIDQGFMILRAERMPARWAILQKSERRKLGHTPKPQPLSEDSLDHAIESLLQ